METPVRRYVHTRTHVHGRTHPQTHRQRHRHTHAYARTHTHTRARARTHRGGAVFGPTWAEAAAVSSGAQRGLGDTQENTRDILQEI